MEELIILKCTVDMLLIYKAYRIYWSKEQCVECELKTWHGMIVDIEK